jgi:hypothetical protein
MNRPRSRKASMFLLFVMIFSLFATSVYARQSDEPTVDVFRIDSMSVIIKITFPSEISGEFAGTLAGKHFDCVTVPPSTLICIGPFRVGPEYATLTIYDQDTKENVFAKALKSPPSNGKGDKEENDSSPVVKPTPCPEEICEQEEG